MSEIYVAKQSAVLMFEGRKTFITGGRTTVREGHPILESHGGLFEPLQVTFDHDRPVESATAAPGERRTVTKRGGVRKAQTKQDSPAQSNEGPTQGLSTDSLNTP